VDHYAPSTARFAAQLQSGQPIGYEGNPLEDLSLIRFLDRFVYRHPKKLESQQRRRSILERHASSRRSANTLVNSAAFLNQAVDKVAPDEVRVFFSNVTSRRQISVSFGGAPRVSPGCAVTHSSMWSLFVVLPQMFFYKYFKQRQDRMPVSAQASATVAATSRSDTGGADDDESFDERELEMVLSKTCPDPMVFPRDGDADDDEHRVHDTGSDDSEMEGDLDDENVWEDEPAEEDEDEEEETETRSQSARSKRSARQGSDLKTINFTGSTFASAEEFAHLLEDRDGDDDDEDPSSAARSRRPATRRRPERPSSSRQRAVPQRSATPSPSQTRRGKHQRSFDRSVDR
jgi:ribosome biogenesis protein MAK21